MPTKNMFSLFDKKTYSLCLHLMLFLDFIKITYHQSKCIISLVCFVNFILLLKLVLKVTLAFLVYNKHHLVSYNGDDAIFVRKQVKCIVILNITIVNKTTLNKYWKLPLQLFSRKSKSSLIWL